MSTSNPVPAGAFESLVDPSALERLGRSMLTELLGGTAAPVASTAIPTPPVPIDGLGTPPGVSANHAPGMPGEGATAPYLVWPSAPGHTPGTQPSAPLTPAPVSEGDFYFLQAGSPAGVSSSTAPMPGIPGGGPGIPAVAAFPPLAAPASANPGSAPSGVGAPGGSMPHSPLPNSAASGVPAGVPLGIPGVELLDAHMILPPLHPAAAAPAPTTMPQVSEPGFYFMDPGVRGVPLETGVPAGGYGLPATQPPAPAAPQPATPGASAFAIPGVDPCDPFMVHPPPPGHPPVATEPSSGYYFIDQPAPQQSAPTTIPQAAGPYDVQIVRKDFPILHKPVGGKPLVWLDNGATTQKPQEVIDAISHFYENDNSNVHRAAHHLAARATEAYENARKIVQQFIGAASPEEIIFTKGTTESINLAANSLGSLLLTPGDEILLAALEHHANIVPWQMVAARTGAKISVVPIDESGQVILDEYYRLLSHRVKIVSLSHVSNVLGTVVPLDKMIDPAHEVGAKVVVDAAQSIAHVPVNVSALNADLLAFSGHKIYGPTGVGVLYGKLPLLEAMPPWQGGGNMIENVSFEKSTYNKPPAKFEAGTAVLAGAVGLGAALNYLRRTGFERALAHEDELLQYAMKLMQTIPGLKILGTAPEKVAVLSFSMAGVPPEEIGRAVTSEGIAIRVGHHCAQPVLRRFGYTSIARASLGMYNTMAEIDKLVSVLYRFRH